MNLREWDDTDIRHKTKITILVIKDSVGDILEDCVYELIKLNASKKLTSDQSSFLYSFLIFKQFLDNMPIPHDMHFRELVTSVCESIVTSFVSCFRVLTVDPETFREEFDKSNLPVLGLFLERVITDIHLGKFTNVSFGALYLIYLKHRSFSEVDDLSPDDFRSYSCRTFVAEDRAVAAFMSDYEHVSAWRLYRNEWDYDVQRLEAVINQSDLTGYEREHIRDIFFKKLAQWGISLPKSVSELKRLESDNYGAYICLVGSVVNIYLEMLDTNDTVLRNLREYPAGVYTGIKLIHKSLTCFAYEFYSQLVHDEPISPCRETVAFLQACELLPKAMTELQDENGNPLTLFNAINGLSYFHFDAEPKDFQMDAYYEFLFGRVVLLSNTLKLRIGNIVPVKKYVVAEPVKPILHSRAEVVQELASQKPKPAKKVVAAVVQEPINFEPAPDKIPNVRVIRDTANWISTQQPFKDYLTRYPNFTGVLNVKEICKEIARCNGGKIPAYEDIKKLFGSHVFTLYMCVPVLYYVAKYDDLFKANFRGNEDLTSKYQTFYGTMATDIIKVMQYSKLRECNSKRPDFLRRTESRLMAFPDQCVELENLIFRMRDAEDTQITFESVGDYISSLSELYS